MKNGYNINILIYIFQQEFDFLRQQIYIKIGKKAKAQNFFLLTTFGNLLSAFVGEVEAIFAVENGCVERSIIRFESSTESC